MRILVDTNVFLDVLLKREGFYEESKQFFMNCFGRHDQLLVTSMSLRDIDYLVSRHAHDHSKGKKAIGRIYGIVWRIVSIDTDDAINALLDHDGDYEDALIMESAERCMSDAIVTNNIKDFGESRVRAFTPREINRIFASLA